MQHLTGVFQGGGGQDHQQGVLWGRAPGTMKSGMQKAQPRPAARSRLSQPRRRLGLSPTCRRAPTTRVAPALLLGTLSLRQSFTPGVRLDSHTHSLEVRGIWRGSGCLDSAEGQNTPHMLAPSSAFCGPAVRCGRRWGLSGEVGRRGGRKRCLLNSPQPRSKPHKETQSPRIE